METQYREQYIRFGLRVQYYRKLRGLTQETFADKIGKSWRFVVRETNYTLREIQEAGFQSTPSL